LDDVVPAFTGLKKAIASLNVTLDDVAFVANAQLIGKITGDLLLTLDDIGIATTVWLRKADPSATWTDQADSSNVWNAQSNSANTWSPQSDSGNAWSDQPDNTTDWTVQ